MARLARLVVAGEPHLVLMKGHNRQAVFIDDDDRRAWVDLMRDALVTQGVALHAWALLPDGVMLVVTPGKAEALGKALQQLARRYGQRFNRRHQRTGTLWEGRYRSAVLEADVALVDALVCVDAAPVRAQLCGDAWDYAWSSASQRMGLTRQFLLQEHPAYWRLGNTPFEREQAFKQRLVDGLSPEREAELTSRADKGWAIGSPEFLAKLTQKHARPAAPRKRGRPPRVVQAGPESVHN